MILGAVREEVDADVHRLVADVCWEDRSPASQRLFIEVATDGVVRPRPTAAAFFPIAAVAAHVHGERRLRVEGAVDPTLVDGLEVACAAFGRWEGRTRAPLRIEADEEVPEPGPPAHTTLLLSGGVDSVASLIANHACFPPRHPRRVRTALVTYGLDASTAGDPRRPDQFLVDTARAAGLDLLAVRTNVRDLDPSPHFWWHNAQTATWSSIAHALGPEVTDLLIGSDVPITSAPIRGSDPVLDAAFSSTGLRIHHGALHLTRQERLAIVAASPRRLALLQVCNEPRVRWRPLNCGRCEKCVRTMLGLEALGVLDRATAFPPAALTAEVVAQVRPSHPSLRVEYAELLPLLVAAGRTDLAAAVRRLLRRIHWLQVKRVGRHIDQRLRSVRRRGARAGGPPRSRGWSPNTSHHPDTRTHRSGAMQPVTIIAGPRDRLSVTERWLENLFATTPGAGDLHRVIFVAGGAPEHLRERWTSRFGDRVEFVFRDEYVNQAVVRNIGLPMAETELAVLADNDAHPRTGWLEAMVRCHEETGAVMVSPLILQKPTEIHCAGTDLYINVRDGKEYGHKHLRYYQMPYCDGSNLHRERIDYGELHFQSVEVATTIEVEAFDEAIIEVGEVDSGLSWAKGGREMFFEPEAVVHFHLRGPIEAVDVPFFAWRWDFDRVAAGYQHFARKWGFDVSEEGNFDRMLLDYNAFVGHLARRHPSPLTLRAGWLAKRLGDGIAQAPRRTRIAYRQRITGTTHRRLSGLSS